MFFILFCAPISGDIFDQKLEIWLFASKPDMGDKEQICMSHVVDESFSTNSKKNDKINFLAVKV